MAAGLDKDQTAGANAAYEALIEMRDRYGAYYPQDDPLRNPAPAVLTAMDQDDPDVRLRQAFNLDKAAASDEQIYERVLVTYRDVRDHADTHARYVLGRYASYGANGVPKNIGVAKYWLWEAVRSDSKPAHQLLDEIGEQHSCAK